MRWLLLALTFAAITYVAEQKVYADTVGDVQKIAAMYADWRDAVEDENLPAYLSILHADVRMLPPGAPVIQGRDGYAEFLEPVFSTATYKFDVDQMPLIDVRGDTAVVEYVYTIHLKLKNPELGIAEPGALTANKSRARYSDVLIKDSDGEWKLWRHSWQIMPLAEAKD